MKIVLFGDSVTEGCFELVRINGKVEIIRDVPSVYGSLLEKDLKRLYPNKDLVFVNHGLSGRNSFEATKCFDELVLKENPDLVIMCFGLNDVCSRDLKLFRNCQKEMLGKLKKNNIKTIVMTPNTMNYYISKYEVSELLVTAKDCASCQNDGTFDKFMDVVREEVKNNGAYLVDAYQVWKKLASYGVDTSLLLCNYINHPSREMHKLFKDMLLNCIVTNKLID